MKALLENHPYLYLLLVALGGLVLIVVAVDGLFYLIGGQNLLDRFGFIAVVAGALWFLPHYLSVSSRLSRK